MVHLKKPSIIGTFLLSHFLCLDHTNYYISSSSPSPTYLNKLTHPLLPLLFSLFLFHLTQFKSFSLAYPILSLSFFSIIVLFWCFASDSFCTSYCRKNKDDFGLFVSKHVQEKILKTFHLYNCGTILKKKSSVCPISLVPGRDSNTSSPFAVPQSKH